MKKTKQFPICLQNLIRNKDTKIRIEKHKKKETDSERNSKEIHQTRNAKHEKVKISKFFFLKMRKI